MPRISTMTTNTTRCISLLLLTIFSLTVASGHVRAELEIQITRGAGNQAPIAVVPFGWEGNSQAPIDIAGVVAADLQRSGRFAPVDEADMLQKPTAGVDVDFDDWSILGVEAVV